MSGTWVPGADGSGFGIGNLPYGVVRRAGDPAPRAAVRVGGHALDLGALAEAGLLDLPPRVFTAGTLNPFLELGRAAWAATRARLEAVLAAGGPAAGAVPGDALVPLGEVEPLLPVAIGDYVDFYSSREHAETVGRIFRPGAEALPPAWLHLPIGYHGRSATVVVSGTPVRRPHGLRAPEAPGGAPTHGPERRLDIEVELGFVTGPGPAHGTPVPARAAEERIFGFVLVNDWSAREIQRFEQPPLGPFLGKSFQTSISPWVVPLEALAGARVPGPAQEPPPAPHLRVPEPRAFDVVLEAHLEPAGAASATRICASNARGLYWSPAQQLAHATSGGAAVRAGDLFASGTVSGPDPGARGCLLEATWDGRDPLRLDDGSERTYLEDGDTVAIRGRAGEVSLGEVTGRVESGAPA